jgi:hypothetical protein
VREADHSFPSNCCLFLWLCSPARATASCGSASQPGLWPPVAPQPSAGYGLLWLCSPARAMASCGSAAQHGLWPPVALQPRASYGLLWLCSPARAMASCGSAAPRGLWPPVALQPSAGYGHSAGLWVGRAGPLLRTLTSRGRKKVVTDRPHVNT